MRVVRTVAGLVLLTIGLPVLLIGGALWTLMQHRDAGGAFSGSLEPVSTSGRAIVVPDVDTLLREDAPFVRAGDTALRLTVREGSGPVFLGLAPAAAVRDYLAGADYSRVDAVTVGRGDLPLRITPIGAAGLTGPLAAPGTQSFWTRQGSGTIEWTANEIDGRDMSLVVMRVDATPGLTVSLAASARSGWLPPTAWSLLALGALLLGSAIASLVWPVRTRELVFVVDPSQVPEVSARLGAATDSGPAGPPPVWPALPAGEVAEPVPVLPGSDRPADGSWPDWPSDSAPGRPATLADALAGAGKSVPPPSGPAWPPAQPGPSAAWPPVPDGASAWSRAEAARLAGMPAVSAAAAQLSVETVPTSGAPSGSATALPRPVDGTPPADPDVRTPSQRSAGSEGEAGVPAAKVAHLRSVPSDEAGLPAAKRGARTAAKKRPVVFVDTATEPTGESPDRPIVPPRSRSARGTKTASKRTPQPREATSATEPAEDTAAKTAGAESTVSEESASDSTAVESPASAAPTTDAARSGSEATEPGLDASVVPTTGEDASTKAALGAIAVPTTDAARSGSEATDPALDASVVPTTGEDASTKAALGAIAVPTTGEDASTKAAPGAIAVPTTDAVGSQGQSIKAAPAASAALTKDAKGSADRATQLALDGPGASELWTPVPSGSDRNAAAAADALAAGVARPAGKAAAGVPTPGSALTAESSGSVGKKVEPALDGLIANAAPTTTAKGSRRAVATKPTKSAAVAAEPTTNGTEVIESTGSDSDDLTAAHGPASAGAPVGTGAVVTTTGAEAGDAAKPRRTTRAKKATDPDAAPAKATRAPRRKTTASAETPAPTVDDPATSADARGQSSTTPGTSTAKSGPNSAGPATSPEVAGGPTETGTPFGGSAAPAKPRRRKTAAGLPAPEATDAGPAHTAVAALVAKRPTTRRPATKATTKRPPADSNNRATPTDQAS
ncbi:hypothetical protein DFJ67_0694 [Asanoa ferruginea]|uniref:Uncharacterized protein n=1 Tax=Asanoa ferruginea TaxID=53367 RepID=A0A3D9ZE62_9ACTN|nr:hypothetical protein [Asanoa ferruginea]REF94752.1 hypothetical protein DFJ67_0694 [Asanoa ferruginea]